MSKKPRKPWPCSPSWKRPADEYRDPVAARRLIAKITARATRSIHIMEFCGGHTHAIMRYGIRQALAPHVRMLSGPGCPVCVTADMDIDHAIALARLPGVTVATFGDMMRVPGTKASLQQARAEGADVRMVYSALDALELARQNPARSVVMLGIGFETTAPTIAASLVQARETGVKNYYTYSMQAIVDAGEVREDAVLGPGHVTAITGWRAWEFLPRDYRVACAVSGFEPLDILQAVYLLTDAVETGHPYVANPYARGVEAEGNRVAQQLMDQVFEVTDAAWRGIGEIPASGLGLRAAYAAPDARLACIRQGLHTRPARRPLHGFQRGVLRGPLPLWGDARWMSE